MATDITTTPRSRRGLLTAAVAAAGAAVAASVARAVPATAADGDEAILGVKNESESTTIFHSENAWALSGTSTNSRGVNGKSEAGQGVHGESTLSAGVSGVSEEGNGVHGTSRDNRGLWGESTNGPGVDAVGATGVRTESAEGYALHSVHGRARFDGISGVVVIKADETEVEIETDVPVNQNTFVLLTPQANLGKKGLWYQVPEDTGKITVRISEARPKDSRIAYLILEHAPA